MTAVFFDLRTCERPFVRVRELARYLDCSERTIIRMVESGALHGAKVGKVWRIETESARAVFHVKRPARHAVTFLPR